LEKFSLLNNIACGLITLTDGRVRNQSMFVTAYLQDWNKDVSFFLSVDSISSKFIRSHVLWKMCSDANYVLKFTVHYSYSAKNTEELNLRHWNFYDETI
jgi:hypothetical protein